MKLATTLTALGDFEGAKVTAARKAVRALTSATARTGVLARLAADGPIAKVLGTPGHPGDHPNVLRAQWQARHLALAVVRWPQAEPILIELVKNPRAARVLRQAAADALLGNEPARDRDDNGRASPIGSPAALAILRDQLDDRDETIALAAAEAILKTDRARAFDRLHVVILKPRRTRKWLADQVASAAACILARDDDPRWLDLADRLVAKQSRTAIALYRAMPLARTIAPLTKLIEADLASGSTSTTALEAIAEAAGRKALPLLHRVAAHPKTTNAIIPVLDLIARVGGRASAGDLAQLGVALETRVAWGAPKHLRALLAKFAKPMPKRKPKPR